MPISYFGKHRRCDRLYECEWAPSWRHGPGVQGVVAGRLLNDCFEGRPVTAQGPVEPASLRLQSARSGHLELRQPYQDIPATP